MHALKHVRMKQVVAYNFLIFFPAEKEDAKKKSEKEIVGDVKKKGILSLWS